MPPPLTAAPSATPMLELPRGRRLELSPAPLIMGVLNITPDSFSDGGKWLEPETAVEHGLRLLAEGADLLDLGAESTRPGGGVYGPGAEAVTEAEELRRLMPVLERLRSTTDAPLSVDTRKGGVAAAALAAGADLVNDVSAMDDPALCEAVVAAGCPIVLMHSRGELGRMQRDIHFDDVVSEVRNELALAMDQAIAAGIERRQIIVDPGIGFGKTAEQSLMLLCRLDAMRDLAPVLVGPSRKSFIGAVTGAPVDTRLAGSLAAVGWAARQAASFVRVHDVAATRQFLDVWRAIEDGDRSPA